jgi:SAM-dependent methyltransferase
MKASSDSTTAPTTSVAASEWAGYYEARGEEGEYTQLDLADFRNLHHKVIIDKIREYFRGGSVIEIGAGDSDRLIDVCKRFAPEKCVGLDYIQAGCDRLKAKADKAGAKLEAVCADMFAPPEGLRRQFDFVMSFGVVEHFHDLPRVVRAIGSFAKPGGIVFTLIPNNKDTVYGRLMYRWNRKVYDAHVLYDAAELEKAHRDAGMTVLWNGHLVSSSFGMLSWCFKDHRPPFTYWIYTQLTRVSKFFWFIESKLGLFKPKRYFSPYVVCVSRVDS